MHTEPMTPQEVANHQSLKMPASVLDCFNQLLMDHPDGVFTTADAINAILAKGYTRDDVHENGWLKRVVTVYAQKGWNVDLRVLSKEELKNRFPDWERPRASPLEYYIFTKP